MPKTSRLVGARALRRWVPWNGAAGVAQVATMLQELQQENTLPAYAMATTLVKEARTVHACSLAQVLSAIVVWRGLRPACCLFQAGNE